jgi:putative FmdB family regulatory protein
MPVYEYLCNACGHEFEEQQKMADEPIKVCPKCKKKKVERLISRTSFHLKGGGWYSDLYGSSKGGAAKTESKFESASETKSEVKTESTTETKADAKPAKAETKKKAATK